MKTPVLGARRRDKEWKHPTEMEDPVNFARLRVAVDTGGYTLDNQRRVLLRCGHHANGYLEVPHQLVVDALNDLSRKFQLAQIGYDRTNHADQLLMMLLEAHADGKEFRDAFPR